MKFRIDYTSTFSGRHATPKPIKRGSEVELTSAADFVRLTETLGGAIMIHPKGHKPFWVDDFIGDWFDGEEEVVSISEAEAKQSIWIERVDGHVS